MREALGNPSGLKVSSMAKWKTAIALSAIGCVLFSMALSQHANDAERFSPVWLLTRGPLMAGLAGIWFAAILSVVTAWDYVAAAGRADEQ